MKVIFAYLIVILQLLVTACSLSESDGASFKNISSEGWVYGDTLVFPIRADSMQASNRLALAVRHSAGYRYANMYVEVSVPQKDTVLVDTVNILLADKYGRRLGRGNGVSYLKIDTLPRIYDLGDSVTVNMRHVMRIDTLQDVTQIGVFVLN